MITRTTLISLGAMAAAVSAIWGAVAVALPLLRSDAPPFVGRANMDQVAASVQDLQRNNAQLQMHQSATDQNVQLMEMQFLENSLDHAREDLRLNPRSVSARSDVCAYIDKIDQIRARIKLPPIPPCDR